MNINEFLEKYQIAKQRFAELTHVGLKTFNKYIEGKPIRESSREKIERGIRITIENNLKCPRCNNNANIWTNMVYQDNVRKYEREFARLFKEAERA